jgi:hypothetical protein
MSQNQKDSLIDNMITKKEIQFTIPIYDSIVKEYTVNEIKKNDKAYIIKIEDTDGWIFTIVSLKCEKQKGKKIRKGGKYSFLLYTHYISEYNSKVVYVGGWGHGNPKLIMSVAKTILVLDYKPAMGTIVTTPNLKGLYYVGSVW